MNDSNTNNDNGSNTQTPKEDFGEADFLNNVPCETPVRSCDLEEGCENCGS
jgi:hypothetical protein